MNSSSLLVLSDAEIRAAVDATEAVQSQRDAYRAVVDESIRLSGSTFAVDPAVDGLVFALTGAIAEQTPITCKFGYQAPENSTRGLPSVHAFVTLLDPITGVPLACLNGTTITTMRTAAGLAVAADTLAVAGSSRLAILGSGVQAKETATMVAAVRPLSSIRIWSPSDRRDALVAELRSELAVPDIRAADSAEDAVRSADLIACCTTSRDPVVQGSWLSPGTTLLTMGSYQPDRREVDLECARRAASVFVDEHSKATDTCGPLIEAFAAGVIAPPDVSEIGSALTGDHPGRRSDKEILMFHSVGIGVQDAALSWRALRSATERGLGIRVENF